jgi:hypothetical protein
MWIVRHEGFGVVPALIPLACAVIHLNVQLKTPMLSTPEIRRRTRLVGAFPDGQSALNLAAARLRHVAGDAGLKKAPKIVSRGFIFAVW